MIRPGKAAARGRGGRLVPAAHSPHSLRLARGKDRTAARADQGLLRDPGDFDTAASVAYHLAMDGLHS